MRTGENYRFGHKIWCDILVEEPVEEFKIEPSTLVVQQPEIELTNQYPSLDLNVNLAESMADKSGNSDGEPVVTVIEQQPKVEESAFEIVKPNGLQNLSTSIS